jgi:uncharacterized protein (TIGR02996 family)
MRSFLFQDAASKRFWNIDLQGSRYTVTYGAVGARGRSLTKEFADQASARAAHDRLIREKLAGGYVEQTGQPPSASLPPLVQQLELAILENPNDRAPHAALADFLMEQDDPALAARGEFIRVQLALEDERLSPPERKQLRQREQKLLRSHRRELVGDWARLVRSTGHQGRGQLDFTTPKVGFERGILSMVTMDEVTVECARAFVRAPQTRMVQRLYLGGWAYEEPGEYEDGEDLPQEGDRDYPSEHIFSTWPYFSNLRVFQFGWTSDEDYGAECWWQCHLRGQNVCNWVAKMPRLEELYLFADEVDTGRLFSIPTLSHLRILQVYHNWDYALETLAANPALGNLTHLLLHPKAEGSWSDASAPYIRREGLRAVLRSPHLSRLTHLRLRMAEIGDEGCQDIVASGALRRLQVLDLRHGTITDEGARILADCPDLGHLEFLDLDGNDLTQKGVELLLGKVRELCADYQQGEGDRREYLRQGDYE